MKLNVKTAALSLALAALGGSQASAVDLRMLMSWDDSYSATIWIPYPYVKMVDQASNGRIKIRTLGPETVPPFEQLQPVSAGAFDLLFTHGGYHTGQTGIASAVDVVDPDPEKRRTSGVWDWVDRHYQEKHGLKLISIPTAATGFQIMLRKPFDEDGTLKGRKLRGTQVYSGVFRLLGATTVVLPPAEIYTSVDKGVIDGLAWPAAGAIGFKFHEVAPYMVRPSYASVSYIIFMNNNAFKKLSAADQKLLIDQGFQLEKDTIATFNRLLGEEDAAMIKQGAKIIQYPKTTKAELEKGFADEAWKLAYRTPGGEGEKFHEFAKSKGMTPQ